MSGYRLNDPDKGIIGPIGLGTVRDLIAAGVVQDDVKVSADGGPWMPIRTFSALFGPVPQEGAPKPSYAGDLGKHSFFKVFYRFHATKVTGLLTLKRDADQKDVYLEDGTPVFVASNVSGEKLGEFLVSRKKLDRDDLGVALQAMATDKGRLGFTLLRLGLMEPADFYAELTEQQVSRLVDLCMWKGGRYQFFAGVKYLGDKTELHLDVRELVLRAARAMTEPFLVERLRAQAQLPLKRHPQPDLDRGAFKLSTVERRAVDTIDGQKSLTALLAATGADPERRLAAMRVVYLLWELDALSFG